MPTLNIDTVDARDRRTHSPLPNPSLPALSQGHSWVHVSFFLKISLLFDADAKWSTNNGQPRPTGRQTNLLAIAEQPFPQRTQQGWRIRNYLGFALKYLDLHKLNSGIVWCKFLILLQWCSRLQYALRINNSSKRARCKKILAIKYKKSAHTAPLTQLQRLNSVFVNWNLIGWRLARDGWLTAVV